MPQEIERKFLLTRLPDFITSSHQPEPIMQGYIVTDVDGPQVRLRSKGAYFYLTVKGKGHLQREETEIQLSAEQFNTLWPLTESKRLTKKRYEIPHGEFTLEVDVFEGNLQGLLVAEVEFSCVDESQKFEVPDWFGKEVTEDHRYKNSHLVTALAIPVQS